MTNQPNWLRAILLATAVLSAPTAWSVEPASKVAPPREAAVPSAQEVTLTHLQAEIADLQALLVGQLPQNASLPALFEIDLSAAQAVTQRIQSLQERLSVEIDTAPAATSNAEKKDTAPSKKASADQVQAKAPVAQADHFVLLRRERDRLRLSFLQLPAERRVALI